MNSDDAARKSKITNQSCNQETQGHSIDSLYQELARLAESSDASALAELFDREKELLFQWADRNNALYSEEQIIELLKNLEELHGGNEHGVFIHGDRVIKITCPPSFGARGGAKDYLHNLMLSNEYLNDDYRVLGLIKNYYISAEQCGDSIIITQPFIRGVKATEEEIANYMESLELFPYKDSKGAVVKNAFMDKGETVKFVDVRPDNVIKSPDGDLFPIDIHILER